MADQTPRKIEVPQNAGLMDGLQSAGRSALFLLGVVSAMLAFFKARDLAGAAAYVQNNIGQVAAAAVSLAGFVAAVYGALKARHRGGQLEDAAANPQNKAVNFK